MLEQKERSTLDICRSFYESYGRPMLHEKYPAYESRIAVGLVGEGSECFGFDDDISRDHDFGLGFCLWLTDGDMAAVGEALAADYQALIQNEGASFAREAFGKDENLAVPRLESRRGVMRISDFYLGILKVAGDMETLIGKNYWIYAEPRWLATAVNGAVFRDDLGEFTAIREKLSAFYPEKFFLYKLAEQLHLFSHGGQSNYPRMMARGDKVAARLCIDQTIRSAMDIAYLLSRKYPPYYKWTFRGIYALPAFVSLPPLLEKLSALPSSENIWKGLSYSAARVFTEDPVIETVEAIAAVLQSEMARQGLVEGTECFLESYVPALTARAEKL